MYWKNSPPRLTSYWSVREKRIGTAQTSAPATCTRMQ